MTDIHHRNIGIQTISKNTDVQTRKVFLQSNRHTLKRFRFAILFFVIFAIIGDPFGHQWNGHAVFAN
jgi:membrane protein YqaA with SNARE-associated domain